MRRGAPAARNLVKALTVVFPGDPAGWAITRAVLDRDAPGLSGKEGFIYVGEKGCAERSFNGVVITPQPALDKSQLLVVPGGTNALFQNGPSDYSSMPATADGLVFSDARYRALAAKAAMR